LTYDQALEFIHGIARFGSKPGLLRVQLLLERMGNPQKKLKFIHVAGTNGKGSTCTMLSRVLSTAGYKVGLYISPFVLDFRERIQVNNEMIEHDEFARSATLVRRHWEILDKQGDTPSEFETVVACAFDYFLRKQVDVVVLEVGMGGRLDATNVIDTPLVSIITSLGMDHMEYLGNTIGAIAFEKCGIIKPDGITVCYPEQEPEAIKVIEERCAQERNPLIFPKEPAVLGMDFFGTRMIYDGLELTVPLIGAHQVKNASTALAALAVVKDRGFPVSDADIVKGIAQTSFPARLEVLGRDPLIVLDGAHNKGGAEVLGKALDMLGDKKIHAVMGMLSNKDLTGILSEILPRCHTLTVVCGRENPLAMPADELAELARPFCDNIYVADSPREGVLSAYALCAPDDMLLSCGSLYLASELRPELVKLGG